MRTAGSVPTTTSTRAPSTTRLSTFGGPFGSKTAVSIGRPRPMASIGRRSPACPRPTSSARPRADQARSRSRHRVRRDRRQWRLGGRGWRGWRITLRRAWLGHVRRREPRGTVGLLVPVLPLQRRLRRRDDRSALGAEHRIHVVPRVRDRGPAHARSGQHALERLPALDRSGLRLDRG